MRFESGTLVRYLRSEPVRRFDRAGRFEGEIRKVMQVAIITRTPDGAEFGKGIYGLVDLVGRKLSGVHVRNFHRDAEIIRGRDLLMWQARERELVARPADRYNPTLNDLVSAQRFYQEKR